MDALLVIDVQTNLVNRKLFKKDLFLSTVNNAIDLYRRRGDPIVFIQHNNEFLVKDTPDWEFFHGIDKRASDIIVQKHHGNAFQSTNLKKILEKHQVTTILACGLVSHGCVKATCIGGRNEGFIVSVLHNGHTTWSKNAAETIENTNKELEDDGIQLKKL